MRKKFRNRVEAGQMLAAQMQDYIHQEDLLVLALPRGGVPVAFEVAKVLHAPLDICLVRKLGVPGHEELAMGAIASSTTQVLNQVLNYDVINSFEIDSVTIAQVAAQELQELQRRDFAYRQGKPPVDIKDKQVILVDDGIATGSTMLAAIAILRQQQPDSIIVAVPIAPPSVYEQLKMEVDAVICLYTPQRMYAIGFWYEDFRQTTDEEVCRLLG